MNGSRIVPAVLESDVESLQSKFRQLDSIGWESWVQIDFCDGKFVPMETVTVDQLPTLNDSMKWEAHLMVDSPKIFDIYKDKGFSRIIVHVEAYKSEADLVEAIDQIKSLNIQPGLAISPQTPIERLGLLETIDFCLILGVNPGKQGLKMIDSTFSRIKALREAFKHVIIEVDGGVTPTNAKKLIEAGADLLATGSAIFGRDEIQTNIQNFEQSIKSKP